MRRDGVELVIGKDQVAEVSQTFEMVILVGVKKKADVRHILIVIWSLLSYSSIINQLCLSIKQQSNFLKHSVHILIMNPHPSQSINLTLITVNLLESRWRALSRRRSLKAEGRIWLMVFLDSVRCNRLVMLAKSFRLTAGCLHQNTTRRFISGQ